jgi:hypothetical protein
MKAIAKSKLSDKQILVVVTGNSVFNGVGQPVAELWTKRLQNLLGPNYCVVNLAMRGGGPFETGYLAAESLFKEHYRVICITLADPAQAMPQGEGTTYGYMYWQARYRNELSNFPARDKAIEERIAAFPVPERERIASSISPISGILSLTDISQQYGIKSLSIPSAHARILLMTHQHLHQLAQDSKIFSTNP